MASANGQENGSINLFVGIFSMLSVAVAVVNEESKHSANSCLLSLCVCFQQVLGWYLCSLPC